MLEGGLPMGMLGRIGVAVYPQNPDIVYLTVENANKEGMSDEERLQELLTHQSSRGMIGGEIYRSDDAGATWRKTNSDDQPIGGGPAYYYGQIRVDPNDPDRIWVLSVRTMASYDGGQTWDMGALGFGGDDHALWINPDDSNHMILGYDHGMGVSFDGGENWTHPDNQSLAQFYAVGFDMSYPYRVAGGLQDNGSHMAYNTNPGSNFIGFEDWDRVGGGDGMYNEFETCTNRYLYNESQFGPIRRLDLWTGESEGIRISDPDMRWNWNAPIQVSPWDCNTIFHAGNRLVRSPDRGTTWEHVSPDLTKADPATLTTGRGGDGNIQYATITTFDQSSLDADVIWVGTDDGNVQVTRDGGENWTLLNANVPNNPEYWVSRVEASHHDPARAYISYTGYRRDDFRAFVYMLELHVERLSRFCQRSLGILQPDRVRSAERLSSRTAAGGRGPGDRSIEDFVVARQEGGTAKRDLLVGNDAGPLDPDALGIGQVRHDVVKDVSTREAERHRWERVARSGLAEDPRSAGGLEARREDLGGAHAELIDQHREPALEGVPKLATGVHVAGHRYEVELPRSGLDPSELGPFGEERTGRRHHHATHPTEISAEVDDHPAAILQRVDRLIEGGHERHHPDVELDHADAVISVLHSAVVEVGRDRGKLAELHQLASDGDPLEGELPRPSFPIGKAHGER